MQVSDTSGKQGLIEDITFLTGVDTNKYPTADRIRNMNEWQRKVWSWIFESYGGWLFIDDNVSYTTGTGDVPYADLNFDSSKSMVPLPSAALSIIGVEIRTVSGGPLEPLQIITYEQFLDMGGDAAFPNTAIPIYALIQGDVIRPIPAPNYTLTAACRVYFDQDFTAIASNATTYVPGFAAPFHRILSIGASLDYAVARVIDKKISSFSALAVDYERRIRSFYAKRLKALNPKKVSVGGSDLVGDYT